MKTTKKIISYVLAFITVFSSFTILPSEFFNLADVSAVELPTEESVAVEANNDEITAEESIAVESNKDEFSIAQSNTEQTYIEGDFIYSIINENEVKIVGQNGASTNIVIPSVTKGKEFPELANKKVTAIGDNAFKGKRLTSVTFGKNLVSIGNYAFYQSLRLINIDLSVCSALKTIGNYAFTENIKLESVIFPDSLEVIGDSAFEKCNLITQIETGSNLKRIGKKAFYGLKGLKTANIKGGNNAIIDEYAFYDTNLQKVTIGDGVEIICSYAFFACEDLLKIDIGNTVTTIKSKAFGLGEGTTEITIGTGITTIEENGIYCDEIWYTKSYDPPEDDAYYFVDRYASIKIYGTELTNFTSESISDGYEKYITSWDETYVTIYCYKHSATEKSIKDSNLKIDLKYIERDIHLTDIKIDGNSIDNFNEETKDYTVYVDNVTTVDVKPVFNCDNVNYKVSVKDNIYTLDIYNDEGIYICSYKITAKKANYVFDVDPIDITVNGVSVNNFKLETKEYEMCVESTKDVSIVPVFKRDNVIYKVAEKDNVYTIDIYDDNFELAYTYKVHIVFDVAPTDITVNGVSVDNFNISTESYIAYVYTFTDVNIVPVFSRDNVNYKITNENNIYTVNIYDDISNLVYSYKITVREYVYNVIGDVTLMLQEISNTKVGGSVVLPKGTYRLQIALGELIFGYGKRVKDYCSATLSDKYKGFITLDTTGGTYTFQFDTVTNKLVIKHNSNLPNEYLIGDLDTILKPVENRPLSIGSQEIPAGTYKFKLSIGGKKHGYNKVVNDASTGSLTLNSKYTADITLNATGGIYTFMLNTETNKLIIRHTSTNNNNIWGVRLTGEIELELDDLSMVGTYIPEATGTIYLEEGCYTFMVNNYGVMYTAGAVINDNGERTLSSRYITPITLNATGGTYEFLFCKNTGYLQITLLRKTK